MMKSENLSDNSIKIEPMKEINHDLISMYLASSEGLPKEASEGLVHISHEILKANHPYQLMQTIDKLWELLNQCAVFCNTQKEQGESKE